MNAGTYTLIGILLTVAIFLANVIFRMGHITARVESLEKWRDGIRADMHEISTKISGLDVSIKELTTIVEERTDRRAYERT